MSRKPGPAKASGEPLTTRPKKKKPSGRRTWKMMDRAAGVAAGMVAQRATSTLWRAATGKKPPVKSEHPELSKFEAISWAVFVGAGVELSKVLIHRATADYWVKSTGGLPPGMKTLKPAAADKEMPAGPLAEEPTGKKKVRSRNRDK